MAKITIGVLEISLQSDVVEKVKLQNKLNEILSKTESAKDRLMDVSGEQDDDKDVILGFKLNQNFLFGSFTRLSVGVQTSIMKEQLEEQNVDINTIVSEADENSAGTLQDTSFFCIQDNILTMSNAHKNRKKLETYFNWLFRENENDHIQVKLTPMANTADKVNLNDISKICLSDNILYKNSTQKISATKKQVISFLKTLLIDAKTKTELDYEEIVSAMITIKINRKELNDNKYEKLNTLLRIADYDDITFEDYKGNRISACSYVMKVKTEVEKSTKGYYNVNEIETKMRNIINKVKKGEVVN